MKKVVLISFVAMFAVGQGCPHTEYSITMSPEGNALSRRAESRTVDNSDTVSIATSQSSVQPVASKPTSEPAWNLMLEGKYTGKLPTVISDNDFANYTPVDSPMGKLCMYFERFTGPIHIGANIQKSLNNIDVWMDIVLECCQSKYSSHPEYEKLRAFFDKDLRDDLKNVMTYRWLEDAVDGLTDSGKAMCYSEKHFLSRVGFYLFERGYFTAEDISLLPEMEIEWGILWKIFAGKAGIKDEKLQVDLIENCRILFGVGDDEKHAKRSAMLMLSPTFKKLLEKESALPGDKEPIDRVIDNLSFNLRILDFWGPTPSSASVVLDLKSADEPLYTNGKFEDGKIGWERNIGSGNVPVFFYAIWTIPDEGFQTKHFGRVFLRGSYLAEYCIWEKSLSESQRKEWREFLETLTPETLEEKLPAFRFKTSPAVVPWPMTQSASQPTSQPVDEPIRGIEIMGRGWQSTTKPTTQSQPASQPR